MPYVGLPEDAIVYSGLPEGATIVSDTGTTDKPGIVSRINEDLVRRGTAISDDLQTKKADETLLGTLKAAPGRALRMTGQAAGLIGDVGGEAISSIVPDKWKSALGEALQHAVNSPTGKPFVQGIATAIDKYDKENPGAIKNLEAMGNIGAMVLGSKPVQKGAMAAEDIASAGASAVKGALTKTPESLDKELASTVTKGINKSIRPGIEGKRTFGQSEKYFKNAQEAVQNIVENKGSLALTSEEGEVVAGTLPQNLRQFTQAIDQTKKQVFSKYDSMAKEAGRAGAQVNLDPVAGELSNMAESKILKKFSPATAQYAKSRAEAILEGGNTLTTTEAQDAIATMNQSLEAFYKNPSYDTASKAYIDSLVVNNLRKDLDRVIETASGPGYQELKRSYGSLKAIERDVNRRAIVDARKNVKGLIDFSDIFSGSAAIHGILTLNPATVGEAAAAKGIAQLYKRLNDPNRIVKSMFEKTEQIMQKKGNIGAQHRPISSVVSETENRTARETSRAAMNQELQGEPGSLAPYGLLQAARLKREREGR